MIMLHKRKPVSLERHTPATRAGATLQNKAPRMFPDNREIGIEQKGSMVVAAVAYRGIM